MPADLVMRAIERSQHRQSSIGGNQPSPQARARR